MVYIGGIASGGLEQHVLGMYVGLDWSIPLGNGWKLQLNRMP